MELGSDWDRTAKTLPPKPPRTGILRFWFHAVRQVSHRTVATWVAIRVAFGCNFLTFAFLDWTLIRRKSPASAGPLSWSVCQCRLRRIRTQNLPIQHFAQRLIGKLRSLEQHIHLWSSFRLNTHHD